MAINDRAEDIAWVKELKQRRSSRLNLILALVIALLAISPAILGIYWEIILP